MYPTLSLSISNKGLEKFLKRPLKYPHLLPDPRLLRGKAETTVLILGQREQQCISPAIWGLLPEGHQGSWRHFQDRHATLSMNMESALRQPWCLPGLEKRRCLVPVTGFFLQHLTPAGLRPYHLYSAPQKPFCLAGFYNTTSDGFHTFTLLTYRWNHPNDQLNNLDNEIPLIIEADQHHRWLNGLFSPKFVRTFPTLPKTFALKAHPLHPDFESQPLETALKPAAL
ncbi:SOS response-associated peptidase family protein [Maribacter sp. 2307ULW6-5]|uniref:SOS response-associated peptidase family protein n=1 Tax=Maribacter sp. 2307ULW6-5 TaxID=3386275 RepID=UPI0039BD3FC9